MQLSCFIFVNISLVNLTSKDLKILFYIIINIFRCNVQTQSIEDYYRISFFVPFLDTFISQLKSRFSEHKSIFQSFGQMFLKQEFNEKKCADLYTFYEDALDCSKSNFLSEVKMWRQRIQGLNIQNALDALLVSVFRSEIYMSKSL